MKKIAIYYSRQIAEQLKKDAQEVGIPVADDTDLLKLAIAAIKKIVDIKSLPGGMVLDDLVLGTLQRLIARGPAKGLERYNRKYIRDTIVPNAVIKMKDNHVPLEKILKDKNMKKVLDYFGLDEDLVERSYSGEKKPLKIINKNLNLGDLLVTKSRPSVFQEFKGDNEYQFIKFWTTSVSNTARNYLRDFADATLDKYKSIAPIVPTFTTYKNPEIKSDAGTMSESILVDEKSETAIEDKFQKKQLFQMLSKIDPRYEVILDNILDSGEPDKDELKKSLGIGDSELKKLSLEFFKDLKSVILKMGLNRDEAARILRAKRIATCVDSIVGRYLDACLL
jgi:hypothetical protein